MPELKVFLDQRPSEIVQASWRQDMVIEEDADLLPPVYMEVA